MKRKAGELRLRVFAGPNGSGKSTIIEAIKNTKIGGYKVDLGTYINADDIAQALLENRFSFSKYNTKVSKKEIMYFAQYSGLLDKKFTATALDSMFSVTKNSIKLLDDLFFQNLAQLVARLLRDRMLQERRRFSFETVFSHESNIDIMRRANDAGYKVYLYFVSTESPEINKYRVQVRVKHKGHAVPEGKIESRYYRSLGFLYEAAELAYQCYFFDNSIDDEPFRLINHFKRKGTEKNWDTKRKAEFTNWFLKYYWNKRG